MAEKIEIRKDDDDGIDEVIMPGVHLEMLDMDHAMLTLEHDGETLLIDIDATVDGGKPLLTVTVAERWEGDE